MAISVSEKGGGERGGAGCDCCSLLYLEPVESLCHLGFWGSMCCLSGENITKLAHYKAARPVVWLGETGVSRALRQSVWRKGGGSEGRAGRVTPGIQAARTAGGLSVTS